MTTTFLETDIGHVVEKTLTRQPHELSTKPTFSVIGNDKKNPWGADTFLLTPNDIRVLTKNAGVPIYATPHIGLHWPSNSIYPYMGVKICDITVNQSVKDTADRPEYVGEQGVLYHCAVEKSQPMLSPHLRLDKSAFAKTNLRAGRQYSHARTLGYVHHMVKKIVLGSENVTLDTELLSASFVPKALRLLIQNEKYILQSPHEQLFSRFVTTSGIVTKAGTSDIDAVDAFLELKQVHASMVSGDIAECGVSGHIPIVEVCILIDALYSYHAQYVQGSTTVVGNAFSVSGISMIHYLKNPRSRDLLQRMYEVLQGAFEWLPLHMRYYIIPGGVFTFLPSSAEPELENAVHAVLESNSELAAVASLFKNGVSQTLIDRKKALSTVHRNALQRFADAHRVRRGFNQYDLLNGETVDSGLFEMLGGLSFEKIRLLFAT